VIRLLYTYENRTIFKKVKYNVSSVKYFVPVNISAYVVPLWSSALICISPKSVPVRVCKTIDDFIYLILFDWAFHMFNLMLSVLICNRTLTDMNERQVQRVYIGRRRQFKRIVHTHLPSSIAFIHWENQYHPVITSRMDCYLQ